MKILLWTFISTLCSCVVSRDHHPVHFPGVSRHEDVLILNEFIDSIIREIPSSPQLVEVFNPLKLERNITFSRGVIHDISVDGLLSLHRQGDITFLPDAPGLTAKLAVNDIDLKFRYRMRTLGIRSDGRLSMSVNNVAMGLEASFRGMKARLDKFEINHFGKVQIRDFTGMSPLLNWLAKPTLQFLLNVSRLKVKNKIESVLREKLEDEFRRVHLEDVIASAVQQ